MSLMGGMYWEQGQYFTIGNVGGFGQVAGLVYQSHLLERSRDKVIAATEHRNA